LLIKNAVLLGAEPGASNAILASFAIIQKSTIAAGLTVLGEYEMVATLAIDALIAVLASIHLEAVNAMLRPMDTPVVVAPIHIVASERQVGIFRVIGVVTVITVFIVTCYNSQSWNDIR
jgi:hypothetical protein